MGILDVVSGLVPSCVCIETEMLILISRFADTIDAWLGRLIQ